MKKIIIFIFLIITFTSCYDSLTSAERKSGERKSEIDNDYEIADLFLMFDAEKIGLISIIKDVPVEKTNSVLRDYLALTFNSKYTYDEDPDLVVKSIDSIAIKNNLSKKLTASIIFSYKYEMITSDEKINE